MKTDVENEATGGHPPDFVLELVLAGEGTRRVTATWRNHLVGCARCAARLADLAKHGIDYGATPQARGVRALLERTARESMPAGRARPRTPARSQWWLGLTAAMVLGLIAIWVGRPRDLGGQDLRIKGQGRLGAVVRRAGHTSSWDGAPLQPADEVQLTWAGPTAGFLVVLAREMEAEMGEGVGVGAEAIVLFPEHGEVAAVSPGRDRAIGASLRITPASRPFVATACFSRVPTRVEVLAEAGRRDAGSDDGTCRGEKHILRFTVRTP